MTITSAFGPLEERISLSWATMRRIRSRQEAAEFAAAAQQISTTTSAWLSPVKG